MIYLGIEYFFQIGFGEFVVEFFEFIWYGEYVVGYDCDQFLCVVVQFGCMCGFVDQIIEQ